MFYRILKFRKQIMLMNLSTHEIVYGIKRRKNTNMYIVLTILLILVITDNLIRANSFIRLVISSEFSPVTVTSDSPVVTLPLHGWQYRTDTSQDSISRIAPTKWRIKIATTIKCTPVIRHPTYPQTEVIFVPAGIGSHFDMFSSR